eukprot:m.125352 g.125352  ORF g.125352 m.125352 type:complete len:211 (+) comp16651_c0_seq3:2063-2695(+)
MAPAPCTTVAWLSTTKLPVHRSCGGIDNKLSDVLSSLLTLCRSFDFLTRRAAWVCSSEVDLDDLDDILNELGDGPELRPLPNDLQRRKSVSDRTKTEVTKCFPALVGGTALATGQNKSGAANRACSRLHCTACDFKICTFDDCSWDADKCDYLFFRNNVPDFHKLKVNLVPTKGTRAYACQCCWRSVRETEPVASLGSDLRWVCGRHPTT